MFRGYIRRFNFISVKIVNNTTQNPKKEHSHIVRMLLFTTFAPPKNCHLLGQMSGEAVPIIFKKLRNISYICPNFK